MGYLWSLQDLERWCESAHQDVRLWAAGRLQEHFSEQAGPLLARLLQDSDEAVACRAAEFFEEHPSPEFAEQLLAAIRTGRKRVLEPCALALAALGDARFAPLCLPLLDEDTSFERFSLWEAFMRIRPAEALEKLHGSIDAALAVTEVFNRKSAAFAAWKNRIALGSQLLLQGRSPEEIERLLRGYLASPQREALGWTVVAAIADEGGAPYSERSLDDRMAKKVKRGLSELEETLLDDVDVFGDPDQASRLLKLLKTGSYTEVILQLHRLAESLRREAVEQWGEASVAAWEQGPSSAAFNLLALRVLKAQIPLPDQREKTVQHRLALLAMIQLSELLPPRKLLGCPLESASTDFLMKQLLDARPDNDDDDGLILELGSRELPPSVAETCLDALKDRDPSVVGRAVRLLGQIRHEPAIPALLQLVDHKDDGVWEDALAELRSMGPATVRHLQGIDWETVKQPDSLADLLAELPFREAEELVLQNFERLRAIAFEAWPELICRLASPQFVAPLQAFAKPGEPDVASYVFLCRLHGVEDPRLAGFEKALDEKAHKDFERLARAGQGGMRALVRDTIPLRLKCVKCSQVYNYEVREVFINPDQKIIESFHLPQRVPCKGCGAANQFQLTNRARWSITSQRILQLAVAQSGQGDPDESPVKFRTMHVDGKPMTPLQGKTYYEEKLAKHPNRVDWRIGYGNILRGLGEDGALEAECHATLKLDPLAVEALVNLGRLEQKRGNPRRALQHFEQALERFPRAHFYRLTTPKEDLEESLRMMAGELREELGLSPLPSEWLPETASAGELEMRGKTYQTPIAHASKVGRNDPCPCGSGKKYKKCCLDKDAAGHQVEGRIEMPATLSTGAERSVQEKIMKFSSQPRYQPEMDRAMELFHGAPDDSMGGRDDPNGMSLQFYDWYVHDYRLANRTTLLQEFQRQEGRHLRPDEAQIVRDEIPAALSFYEVLESHPERAEIHLQDLFTHEELVAKDAQGSRQLVQWDLLGTRISRVGANLRMAGVSYLFQPIDREDILRYFGAAWEEYRREHGEVSWREFMKSEGHRMFQFQSQRRDRGPSRPTTPEYHAIVISKAHYKVDNYHGAAHRLKSETDFLWENSGAEDLPRLAFSWVKRGASRNLIALGKVTDGIVLQSYTSTNPSTLGATVLGSVTLTGTDLTLEAVSRERLKAGKQRLEGILGSYVRFEREGFQPYLARHQAGKKTGEAQPQALEIPKDQQEAREAALLASHYQAWPNMSLPALNGKTPLETAATAEGKARVETLVRQLENAEARKQREGKVSVAVKALRKVLGL